MRWVVIAMAAACSHAPAGNAIDAAADAPDVPPDAVITGCATPSGESGSCLATAGCAALSDHTSVAGVCPGPADIKCCVITPNVADNPALPLGYTLMVQADVTPDMTAWAVAILHDPVTYPMYSSAMMTFGALTVLARVEWHPPDFQNSVVHRGVTLYKPA
ncbi:MAG: hypothetical protein ABI591_23535 [Kofleriaceae bacterium]